VYYAGETKTVPINELIKQFPHLDNEALEDIIKKYPELKGTELDNSAIINSLKKRGMSTDVRAYDFHEFTNPNFKQRLIDVDDMHEVAKKIGTDFLDPADFLNQYLKITGIK